MRIVVDNPGELLGAYAVEYPSFIDHKGRAAPKAFAALRAVLDLHKPTRDGHYCEECVRVQACCYDDVTAEASWPCGTVDAITAALEAS